MKTYKYSARDSKGRIAKGELEATDIAALKNKLRNQGLWLISQNSSQQSLLPFLEGFFDKKIGLKDMVVFSRQFSAMIEAGIAILRVLTVLIQQTENPKLKAILQEIKRDIEQGVPLSESMQKFPEAFDSLYVSMVKAGELGGVLDVVLNRVAGFLESRSKLSNKVRTALTYPASLLVISILVVWFMLTFILPKFSAIFTSTGGELPAFTQLLINISNVLRSPFILVIVAFIWFAVSYARSYYQSEEGRLKIDTFSLKIPIFGPILKKVAIARFSRTFGTLIESGVPITTALDVTRTSINNALLESVLIKVKKDIEEGSPISNQLQKSDVFPPMVTQMVAIGEEAGELENMLNKIADFYDDEVDSSVESLTALMEPVFIVVIGAIVGAIVVAMYLPIFNVINQIN
ncbi:MAG: type II secretion system F family protein [Candidatus Melainabacteria bacterium]|nr:type II secretion system F family protein [Candidatus Melainabacteria bacterium]